MKEYYISVKMRFAGELYPVSGPYNTFEEAENDLDVQSWIWEDSLDEDEYLGIVVHDKNDETDKPVKKTESKDHSANATENEYNDLASMTYSQGHHLFPWILLSVFCFGVGIPFIIYYSVSPNHHWE